MADYSGRQVTQWTEAQFARNRYYNYLGNAMPKTISVKELADNTTDQVTDKKTNKGYLEIGRDLSSITVVDGGKGISLRKTIREDTGNETTFLYLAIAKMYSSTNYDDESGNAGDTVGQNGLGSKVTNFCSSHFTAGKVASHPAKHHVYKVVSKTTGEDGKPFSECFDQSIHDEFYNEPTGAVCGYHFMQGKPMISEDHEMGEATPEWIAVNVPLLPDEDHVYGYFVHAEYDNKILGDDIDVDWIKNYIKIRLESAQAGKEDIFFTFRYPEFDADGNFTSMKEIIYVRPVSVKEFQETHKKEIEEGKYEVLISWEDQVNDIVNDPANENQVFTAHLGYFDMLFAKNADILKDVNNVCQGAFVQNPKSISVGFDVAGKTVKMTCPVVWKLNAKNARGLKYSDQTKSKLESNKKTPKAVHLNNLEAAMRKIPELMNHWQSEANSKFLKKQGKSLQSDFYWPSTGGCSAREYFSTPYKKHPEWSIQALKMVKDDNDVIKFANNKKIDIDKLLKLEGKKIDEKSLHTIVELVMIYNGVKEDKFDEDFQILMVVEGHSASSGIRSKRNSQVVGVLALRGKILNTQNMTLAHAMKSEIIKEFLKVIQDDKYDRIIVTTDADAEGSSITTLILGCLARFRKDLLKNNKIFNCLAPFYTFKDKVGNLVDWSNDPSDCPKGCTKDVNKGLGSYSLDDISRLILYPTAGAEWELIEYDRKAASSLNFALTEGGKRWVYKDNANNEPVPFVV